MSHAPSFANTLSSELTDTLRDAIITGEIPQGAKLSETKLAKELDVSRGPLREAIRRLEGMNLIQHIPQQGARVVTLSMELVLQIYETREALESKAVALAALNMSSQEIDQLHRLIDAQSKHMRENSGAFIPAESDYAFHETIIRGSKNKVIEAALLRELYNLIKMFRYQNEFARNSSTNSLIEHRQIVYAIELRDAQLAEVTMRRHIVHARERIQRRMSASAI
ncbi:GntR family transcriptional regulator [Arenicella xantha]|uniref:DNA-binding GntR family transcriptional regulator n=1 Tax=Arenicella xantha TaxID=644221 RepID=A0A395JT01_9GAMM|nr:GntR family transcriptional regulator [Arenicella xantha]RBP52688.1 DNA-binding GntR family transcriptional regulator [Arenicella xantha]